MENKEPEEHVKKASSSTPAKKKKKKKPTTSSLVVAGVGVGKPNDASSNESTPESKKRKKSKKTEKVENDDERSFEGEDNYLSEITASSDSEGEGEGEGEREREGDKEKQREKRERREKRIKKAKREQQKVALTMSDQMRQHIGRLPEEGEQEGVDDEAIAAMLAEEDQLKSPEAISSGNKFDQRIRRLFGNNMANLVSRRFQPRVNRQKKQASAKARREAYQVKRKRLKARMKEYELAEYRVRGDGSCQFSSLSDQLYRTTRLSAVVRGLVVKHLRANAETYATFVPGNYKRYCNWMAKRGVWGDHITLQAAADMFGVQINLITSYKDSVLMEITPREQRADKILWLSFLAECHYNSLYKYEDLEVRKGLNEREVERQSYKDHEELSTVKTGFLSESCLLA